MMMMKKEWIGGRAEEVEKGKRRKGWREGEEDEGEMGKEGGKRL